MLTRLINYSKYFHFWFYWKYFQDGRLHNFDLAWEFWHPSWGLLICYSLFCTCLNSEVNSYNNEIFILCLCILKYVCVLLLFLHMEYTRLQSLIYLGLTWDCIHKLESKNIGLNTRYLFTWSCRFGLLLLAVSPRISKNLEIMVTSLL